jgi:hypothetical protein
MESTQIKPTPVMKLFDIYQAQGFDIQSGLNPTHIMSGFNATASCDAPATYLYRNNFELLDTGGGGVSLHEIPVFEYLSHVMKFKSIFIVGNSFGWSTLLVSILWPEAQVVALDCGFFPSPTALHRRFKSFLQKLRNERVWNVNDLDFGIKFTNDMAAQHKLNVRVIKGSSPGDVKQTVSTHLAERPDFAFIDGRHTLPQVLMDYQAIKEVASVNCVYLFHDIINFKLEKSFAQIVDESGMEGRILWRTCSGMGILYPKHMAEQLAPLLNIYSQKDEFVYHARRNYRRKKIALIIEVVLLDSGFDRLMRRFFGAKK